MMFWGHQRNLEEGRDVAPAGGYRPAGAAAAVPPPFLVYKRRLYVLARKPPVLDHRQVMMDSVFGLPDRPGPAPVGHPRQRRRVAIRAPAAQKTPPAGRQPVADPKGRPAFRPRFVPRDY